MKDQNSQIKFNPFVQIQYRWYIIILVYIIICNFLYPISYSFFIDTAALAVPRLIIHLTYQVLLFLPIFIYRKEWGWLHPLIFPVIYSLIINIGVNPLTLFKIFNFSEYNLLQHPALMSLSEYEMARVYLKADLIKIISLICYYIGFFGITKIKVPEIQFRKPSRFKVKALTFITISVVLFLYFLQSQGGINNHILSFAKGRFRALEGTGHIRAAITSLSMIGALAWYVYKPKAFSNPFFWGIFLFTILNGFLVSGSRSSIFFSLALFLMIWMIRHQKIPAIKTVIIAIIGFLFIGVLGELRSMGNKADALDMSVLTNTSIEEKIESTQEHIEGRSSGYIAVVGKAIEDEGLLLGRTYLGAAFFWIPRAVWDSKPRGAGAYVGNLLYGNASLEQNPQGGRAGGVPPGGVGEAYWNFHILGVIIIYFIFGLVMQWLARFLRRYHKQPTAWLLYVVVLFKIDPETIKLVDLFQTIVPLIVFLYWLKTISFKSN